MITRVNGRAVALREARASGTFYAKGWISDVSREIPDPWFYGDEQDIRAYGLEPISAAFWQDPDPRYRTDHYPDGSLPLR